MSSLLRSSERRWSALLPRAGNSTRCASYSRKLRRGRWRIAPTPFRNCWDALPQRWSYLRSGAPRVSVGVVLKRMGKHDGAAASGTGGLRRPEELCVMNNQLGRKRCHR